MKDNKMQITKNGSLSKVDEKFYELKNNKKLALMPFIMAGDPNIEITSEILLKLQENGADLIELGIPYSDPLADGPVIQVAASRALKSGTNPRKVIKLLESLKGKLNIPIILFSYLNPLICFGFEKFCEMASNAGVSGLIVPDLPLEEAYKFSKIVSNKFLLLMKKYLISGLVDTYRIKLNLFALSPNSAISIFKQKYPSAEDVYVVQDLFKRK